MIVGITNSRFQPALAERHVSLLLASPFASETRGHPISSTSNDGSETVLPMSKMQEGFRYLVYLNKVAFGEPVVKTMDLCDQKTAP